MTHKQGCPANAESITLPTLADDETYAGLSRDHETGTLHHLILLAARPTDGLNWKAAIEWAKSVGGELPTRFESALLYANCRELIYRDYWYWTATPYAGDDRYAWNQDFSLGDQYGTRKDYADRAVAVRRVRIGP